MIRVTVELISAVHPSRSRVLGTVEICNDATGDEQTGNYTGTLRAEYTGKDGRTGMVRGFKRQRQSVFSLLGAFLKAWGHMKHAGQDTTPLATLEDEKKCTCYTACCPIHQQCERPPGKAKCAACDRGDFTLGHSDDCVVSIMRKDPMF